MANDSLESGQVLADGTVVGQDYVRMGSAVVLPHADPKPNSGRNVLGFNPDLPYEIVDDPDLNAMASTPKPIMKVKPALKPPVASKPAPVAPTPPPVVEVEDMEEDIDVDSVLSQMQAEAVNHPPQSLVPQATSSHLQALLQQQQAAANKPTKLVKIVTPAVTFPVLYHSVDIVTGQDGRTPLLILGWDLSCHDHVLPPVFQPCEWDNPLTMWVQDSLLACIYQGISFESRGYRYVVLFYDPQKTVQVQNGQAGQVTGTSDAVRHLR